MNYTLTTLWAIPFTKYNFCFKSVFHFLIKCNAFISGMSWDNYIDNIIGQSVDYAGALHCERACIIGLNGIIWTTNRHRQSLKVSLKEATIIAEGIKGGDPLFFKKGVTIENVKYQFIKRDESSVVAKHGTQILILHRSLISVVIGLSVKNGQQGCVDKAVSLVADYLLQENL